jgi:hypothetical protein
MKSLSEFKTTFRDAYNNIDCDLHQFLRTHKEEFLYFAHAIIEEERDGVVLVLAPEIRLRDTVLPMATAMDNASLFDALFTQIMEL